MSVFPSTNSRKTREPLLFLYSSLFCSVFHLFHCFRLFHVSLSIRHQVWAEFVLGRQKNSDRQKKRSILLKRSRLLTVSNPLPGRSRSFFVAMAKQVFHLVQFRPSTFLVVPAIPSRSKLCIFFRNCFVHSNTFLGDHLFRWIMLVSAIHLASLPSSLVLSAICGSRMMNSAQQTFSLPGNP